MACFPSHWPGRSRGRWRRQSRSRQSHFHTLSPRFLWAYHTAGYWDTPTWSHATPRPSHSWNTHTGVIGSYTGFFGQQHFLESKSRITWREESTPGKRSGSCCGDLLRSRHSVQCFQTPEEAGEQLLIECNTKQERSTQITEFCPLLKLRPKLRPHPRH